MDASSPPNDAVTPLAFNDLAAQQDRIKDRIDAALADVLARGQYILGPQVAELEGALARFCGAKNCVACANGTDALSLVLMAEGVGAGDAVFVPSFTFVATAEAVLGRGAVPVFVDIDSESYNMDPASLARAIDASDAVGLRPRMVIAVDLYGQPADYTALFTVAQKEGLVLVADAAQSFGATLDSKCVGTLADYTTTSFFPAKPLGCYGDGGAIFTESGVKADILQSLRFHGKGTDKYENIRVGLNSRLDTLQAAILLVKLEILASEIAARQDVARRYGEMLSNVEIPTVAQNATSVWAQYTVRLPEGIDRGSIQSTCQKAGIPTMVYYPIPLHRQPAYTRCPYDPAGLAQSEEAAAHVLSLPMHPYLTREMQSRVAETLALAISSSPNHVDLAKP